jgi:hypothetical protein
MTSLVERPAVATGQQERPSAVARVLGMAPYALLGMVLLVWVKVIARPLTMPDTFFNLRYGQEFLSGHWSLTNPGSPTSFATAHWTPTQWSSEVVMAWFQNHFGLAGVLWLMGSIGLLLLVAIYRLARLEGGPMAASLVTAVTVFLMSVSLSPRAQLISYLCTAVFVIAVMRMRADGRVRWWLVPLMWVWVTAHGMWPVGLSIAAVGALGIVLENRSREVTRRMVAFVGLLVVAAAATPVGVKAYEAVMAVSSRRSYIIEWAPTNFMSPANALLAICFVGVLVAGLRRSTRMPWTDTLLLVLGLGWALYCSRGVPVAAVILVPYLARVLQQGMRTRRTHAREGWIVGVIAVAASAVLAGSAAGQPGAPFQNGSWETAALNAMPAGTVVLNEPTLGGYLIWKYPSLTVTSYGYFDTYTDAQFNELVQLQHALPGWVEDVRTSKAKVALLATNSPLAYGLVQTLHWTVVQGDASYELLRAPG